MDTHTPNPHHTAAGAQGLAINTDPPATASGPTPLDRRLAAPMFGLTLLFLALMAGALHVGAERLPVESDDEGAMPAAIVDPTADVAEATEQTLLICGMLALYPLYLLEALCHWRSGARRLRQHVAYCLLPPLRLGARDHADGRSIWLPGVGWATVDDALRRRVERGAHTPMMAVALLVLPLLAAQHYLNEHVRHSGGLLLAVEAGAAVIWLAFTFEFIVMFAIAPRRVTYARQHWLDLLIICFPLIAFLRFARLTGLLRVTRLGRMQQLAKVFRLKGTMMRLWRAVLLLELLDRVFRRPEKRLAALRERLTAREEEVAELKREIAQLESRLVEASPAVGVPPSGGRVPIDAKPPEGGTPTGTGRVAESGVAACRELTSVEGTTATCS